MPVIQVLDKAVAELIAAGEVVERPASIVKELLENSIDAGADSISVEIENGGVSLIRITDTGCGIAAEDLPKAFLRHATSKISSAEDLDSILTLGFRGEALASIAAMSKVEIITKIPAGEGVSCRAEGGEIFQIEPAGCPNGTTIMVRDVFYNTPARMKFLKKDASEGSAVAQVVDKCALSHPEIAFRFRRDGKVTLQTSGNGDLLAVIYAIYGKEFAAQLTPVDYTAENGIRVTGFISKPEGAKPSRTYQTFFINNRYVRTRTAMAALEQAYKGKIMTGKFPCCVLNIQLDAGIVDVNVHPAKIEVRFADEKPVFNAVYFGVKTALSKLEQSILSFGEIKATDREAPKTQKQTPQPILRQDLHAPQQRMTAQEFQVLFAEEEEQAGFSSPLPLHAANTAAKIRPDIYVDDGWNSFSEKKQQHSAISDKKHPLDYGILFLKDAVNSAETVTDTTESVFEAPRQLELDTPGHRLIGELFGTYILLELGDSLVLVDKHAAHERILYEQLKENLAYGNRQVLLSAQTVTLPREDYASLVEHLDTLETLGFAVEDFGGSTVIVREIPIELGQQDVVYVLSEIADKIKRNLSDLTPRVLDRLYYSIACRGAVKAGDKNAQPELAEIVKLLDHNPQITHCPHGRPVSVKLGKDEIEKLFGRQG